MYASWGNFDKVFNDLGILYDYMYLGMNLHMYKQL